MVKGIHVQDILRALPETERAEFARELKRETGVGLTLTVAGKSRVRKHRWASVKGHPVTVRFADAEFKVVSARAAAKGLSVGLYLKWLATRSHHRPGQRDLL